MLQNIYMHCFVSIWEKTPLTWGWQRPTLVCVRVKEGGLGYRLFKGQLGIIVDELVRTVEPVPEREREREREGGREREGEREREREREREGERERERESEREREREGERESKRGREEGR